MDENSVTTVERRCIARRRACKGATIAELAVLLPLFIVVLIGAIDLGRAYFDSLSLESAAHAGAQYGVFLQSNAADSTGIRAAVLRDLGYGGPNGTILGTVDSDQVKVSVNRYCNCPDGQVVSCDDGTCDGEIIPRRTYVQVQVDRPFHTLFQYPLVPKDLVMTGNAELRAR